MLTLVGLVKNLSQSEQMILVVLKGMSFERARIFTKSKHLQCKPALILKVAFFQKVRCVFQISKSQKKNIPNHYPELEI